MKSEQLKSNNNTIVHLTGEVLSIGDRVWFDGLYQITLHIKYSKGTREINPFIYMTENQKKNLKVGSFIHALCHIDIKEETKKNNYQKDFPVMMVDNFNTVAKDTYCHTVDFIGVLKNDPNEDTACNNNVQYNYSTVELDFGNKKWDFPMISRGEPAEYISKLTKGVNVNGKGFVKFAKHTMTLKKGKFTFDSIEISMRRFL